MNRPSPTANAQDVTATHTPGPWSMSSPPYDSIPWHHVYGPDGRHIMHRERPSGEKIATTFLIAAAPDLLEALRTKRDYVADAASGALAYESSGEGFKAMAKEDLARIDAALAKATAA